MTAIENGKRGEKGREKGWEKGRKIRKQIVGRYDWINEKN